MSTTEKRNSTYSAVITALTLAVACLIASFVGLMPPDPPPVEEGVEVNLGNSDVGFGDSESETISEQVRPAAAPSSASEQLSTQSTEETVSLESSNNKPSKVTADNNKSEADPQPEINQRALFSGSRNRQDGSSQGVRQGEGDQGQAGGDPTSSSYNGAPGQGGFGFSLTGRKASSIPKPIYNSSKQGKVIVSIKVNRKGQVIEAHAPEKGSTILSGSLVEEARKAALQARFNESESAPEVQSGTITYYFVNSN